MSKLNPGRLPRNQNFRDTQADIDDDIESKNDEDNEIKNDEENEIKNEGNEIKNETEIKSDGDENEIKNDDEENEIKNDEEKEDDIDDADNEIEKEFVKVEKNTTTEESEENRSGQGHARKSINLVGAQNELGHVRQKKQTEENPNFIEDNFDPVSHKGNTLGGGGGLRRKRNVASSLHMENRKSTNICFQPNSQIRIKTSSGIYNITEEYCDSCDNNTSVCSYSIPLSKYLHDEIIGVVFGVPTNKVTHCSINRSPLVCPGVNDITPRYKDFTETVDIPRDTNENEIKVEAHRESYHKFRISQSNESITNLCEENNSENFVEINIKLYRDCNG